MKKTTFIILGLLAFLSCGETVYRENNYMFQLPQKDVFVKTSKRPGGRFVIFFAQDSLSLNNSKDSIELRTIDYIQIIVNTSDIYARTSYSTIQSVGCSKYNIEIVPDNFFINNFFENNKRKPPYTFINIDTKEYNIIVNEQIIKRGNIYGE